MHLIRGVQQIQFFPFGWVRADNVCENLWSLQTSVVRMSISLLVRSLQPYRDYKILLIVLVAVFIALNTVDAILTQYTIGLGTGAQETNPLMAAIIDVGNLFLFVKLLVVPFVISVATIVAWRSIRPQKRGIFLGFLYTMALIDGFCILIVINGVKVCQMAGGF